MIGSRYPFLGGAGGRGGGVDGRVGEPRSWSGVRGGTGAGLGGDGARCLIRRASMMVPIRHARAEMQPTRRCRDRPTAASPVSDYSLIAQIPLRANSFRLRARNCKSLILGSIPTGASGVKLL